MILQFGSQFIEKIHNGIKIHTTRKDTHDTWKPGKKIIFTHSETGEPFIYRRCVSVQDIYIFKNQNLYIDEKQIFNTGEDIFYTNSGFDCKADLLNYFKLPFFGKIIHWTDYRY